MILGQEPWQKHSISPPPPSLIIPTDASLSGWGGSLPDQGDSGDLVFGVQPVPHQHPRGNGGFSHSQEASPDEGFSHPSSSGLFGSGALHRQDGIQVTPGESCLDGHPLSGEEAGMAPFGIPLGGRSECNGERPIQNNGSRNGVVSRHSILPGDTASGTGPSSRPLCHRDQQQIASICLIQPGSSGICHRRHVFGLEPVGKYLSLPSGQSLGTGFGR